MDLSQLKVEIAKGLLEKNINKTKYNSIIQRARLRAKIKILEFLMESYPNNAEEYHNRIKILSDTLNDNEELKNADNEYLKEYHRTSINKTVNGLNYEKILKDKINQTSKRARISYPKIGDY